MDSFDISILKFLNSFAGKSYFFDKINTSLENWNLFKGVIAMTVFWGLWFRTTSEEKQYQTRTHILSTFVACVFSLAANTILLITLPFKLRPIHNVDLYFQIPYWLQTSTLSSFSSFPSDHAVLYFTLATGLWFVSRTIGAIAFVYVFFVICAPRIYLGFHYPTDILAGALIGIFFTCFFNLEKIRNSIANPAFRLLSKSPGIFYGCLFFITYEVPVQFNDFEIIVKKALKAFNLL